MSACTLVPSQIHHTRHGTPSHFLRRKGLSIWIDLDDLDTANGQSTLFSVDRFNLLSFAQRDYGPNYLHSKPVESLAGYARRLAGELCPDVVIASVHLLTFPRVLGVAFNPVSVYVLRDGDGRDALLIYEVHNTFGDLHSYAGVPNHDGAVLHATKLFHVSPFFPMDGEYRLMIRGGGADGPVRLLMRYLSNGSARLTATLRGSPERMTTWGIVKSLCKTGQWPLRPLMSIHFEAVKLWIKKVPFYRRPEPPAAWSEARSGK
jgi:DUF1365 family protein